jgi:gamma-glutamyltranspeptidase/glutathione hydrolase
MPRDGIQSFSVPGAPHAYWTLHQQFGSRPWAELLAPAIRGAEDGLPLSERLAATIARSRTRLERSGAGAAEFFPDGQAPVAGARLRRPGYARTLRVLAEQGVGAFYEGELADEIVRFAQQHGSLYTVEDFAAQETEVYTPIHSTYRGVTVHETRPVSQGLLVLEMLNILEGFDLAAGGPGTAAILASWTSRSTRCCPRSSPPAGGARLTRCGPRRRWPARCRSRSTATPATSVLPMASATPSPSFTAYPPGSGAAWWPAPPAWC